MASVTSITSRRRMASMDLLDASDPNDLLPKCNAKHCENGSVTKFFLPVISGPPKVKHYCGAHAAQFIIMREEVGL